MERGFFMLCVPITVFSRHGAVDIRQYFCYFPATAAENELII